MAEGPSSEPSEAEKAGVRAQLRGTLDKLNENRSNLTQTNSRGLCEVQKQTNEIWGKTKTDARSAALDAAVLHQVSVLGAEQAGNLEKKSEGFIRNLRQKYGVGASVDGERSRIHWERLGQAIGEAAIYAHVPAVTFLLGDFVAQAPKPRQERKRKERAPVEEVQTAKHVDVKELQEGAESKAQTARMHTLKTAIREHAKASADGRVPLFRMLLNPNSFSQTVENFFDLAFLVKDGWMEIGPDDEGGAYVAPAAPPTDDGRPKAPSKQNILTLDHPTWLKLCKRWCEGGTLLPPR
ncbi:hypothetical protein EMIHUDRAFT_355518 [Emiliania huxleyi CCMP1516]|jgi:hypothetical protein|uniref:Non-structural maintenance of chromosomes element 4 n=2 Tax=Emiliania huxleyi TaxID=2903 RepID=A0A0D3J5H8_EMIH1|nr:hypothetical protein EMIHUDRAFT_355518 [Emiliania huxleyi CCMP1516]EOD18763.1 hypothetical protein EMIHUDRAFT_355518 [Emiliania huxleyi CCMP1516]|eukprot:XP_005771192.1 hypothetical protein EMIHUDRAFT_355518 [Emiliania huxleyi CCMP1516]